VAEYCSPPAANRHLAALRGVLREAWRLGVISGEDLARAIDLVGVTGTSLPTGRYVEDGEVRRLVAAPSRCAAVVDEVLRRICCGVRLLGLGWAPTLGDKWCGAPKPFWWRRRGARIV